MTIEFTCKDLTLSAEDKELMTRRVLFALSRFQARIRRINIRLIDDNGPKGGVDKKCTMEAILHRGGSIMAEDSSERIYGAAAMAADRLARRIDRELKNRRAFDRELASA